MSKALIALSGGVDSSVAAKLMVERGVECIGCTMKLYDNEDAGISRRRTCCSLNDIEDARSVAFQLGIPYYVFNFKDEFREKVITRFVGDYQAGRTPNPCIDCNRYMKFDKLFERAKILGCEYIVTGHYARIERGGDGTYVLKKAVDESKDQSYVLYSLTQELLAHIIFPLGETRKTDARLIAEKSGFVTAHKHDSQDICFVPNGDYASIVELHSHLKSEPGLFFCTDGCILGEHKGIIRYTVGQRRGLGISSPEALYVCKIIPQENAVVLGTERQLYSKEADATDFNWISGHPPSEKLRCMAKIRYRHREQWASVETHGDRAVHVVFDEPQRAITPGQALVLYDGDIVLGGGVIN